MQLRNMTPDLALIRADGLTLEPQTAAHAEEMFVVLSDPAIYEYENRPPRSLEWLRERFARLESRCSADGSEQWLNWVIRLPDSELAGYVQATVQTDGRAGIAYELSSAYWGRGLARRAVQAMIAELAERYHVHTLTAVLKRENRRSLRLLERLGFSLASAKSHVEHNVDPGEVLMQREVQTHERTAASDSAMASFVSRKRKQS
jgi:[ribosomal protein S5]-alanine N-acetyltransferase